MYLYVVYSYLYIFQKVISDLKYICNYNYLKLIFWRNGQSLKDIRNLTDPYLPICLLCMLILGFISGVSGTNNKQNPMVASMIVLYKVKGR